MRNLINRSRSCYINPVVGWCDLHPNITQFCIRLVFVFILPPPSRIVCPVSKTKRQTGEDWQENRLGHDPDDIAWGDRVHNLGNIKMTDASVIFNPGDCAIERPSKGQKNDPMIKGHVRSKFTGPAVH